MANITITTGANFIPELWSMETQRATEAALVMAPLVKRFDSLVKGRGDTIHIPHISNLVANNKTANTEVQTQTITESETTLEINAWKETSFEIEDMVKVQSNYDLMSEYTNKAGYAIAQSVDTSLLALYSGLSNPAVGTYGVPMTDAVLVSAIQALDEANCPIEDRQLVIKPSDKANIMKLDKFVKADYLGQYNQATPVVRGPNNRYLWGEIYGTPVYYTTQVAQTLASPVENHGILFHKEAFALALQQAPRTQSNYWAKDLAWLVTVDVIFGSKVYRPTFGVEVKS